MTCALPHIMRAAEEADVAFLRDPWVQEMRHSPWCKGIDGETYFPQMKLFVSRLLRRSSTLIACNPENPTHIFGFVTFHAPTYLHWIYVKSAYQKIGLGHELLEAARQHGLDERLVATQASGKCFDKFDRKHERIHVGYFSDERSIKVTFDPFFHTRNQNASVTPSHEVAASP